MGSASSASAEERLRRARSALARAEEHAGLRTPAQRSLEGLGGGTPAVGVALPGATPAGVGLGVVVGGGVARDEGDPARPGGPDPLAGAEGSGTTVGRVLEVGSGTGSLLRAAAAVLPGQGWIGFVGVHDIGWVAAREAGIDLARVVSVPDPGPLAADVVATLLDGVDVLCVDGVELSAPQQRRLAARVRRDGQVVLSTRAWPGVSRPHRPPLPRAGEEAV